MPPQNAKGGQQQEPVYHPTLANHVLQAIALVLIVVGSALLWANSNNVTVDSNAQKSANYYIVGFLYIWLVSEAIVIMRARDSHASAGALYLVLGGMLFEVITRSQIISWAYSNLWRIYSADITRLSYTPTSSQSTAVKCMLAGGILAHIGALLSTVAACYHKNQHFSIKGTYISLAGWWFAIPGVLTLFTSNVCTLQTINSSTTVYLSAWLIIDTALGILVLQTIGVLFDTFELVACAVVISGTHGVFLLGDMFLLQYQRSLYPDYANDGDRVTAGGVLCWLSVLVALLGALIFFRKRHVVYYKQSAS